MRVVSVSAIPWRKVFKKENVEVILACTIVYTSTVNQFGAHLQLHPGPGIFCYTGVFFFVAFSVITSSKMISRT